VSQRGVEACMLSKNGRIMKKMVRELLLALMGGGD